MKSSIKTRVFKDKNYKSVWHNSKTLRIALDPNKPIKELDYPEFYDIKITSKCEGKCPWCYMASNKEDEHFSNIVNKVNAFFGSMTENERPFQIAAGGGEPTSHPDFTKFLKAVYSLGIEPNYTTNGMWLQDTDEKQLELLKTTYEVCGGVAVSCHPHLEGYWTKAAEMYHNHNIPLNFHIIISDVESVKRFLEIREQWFNKVDNFVLLPYETLGRAHKVIHLQKAWDYLLNNLDSDEKIAFGANFYPYLCQNNSKKLNVSLYEPEIMSKFISLEGTGTLYPSSFKTDTVLKTGLFKDE